MNAAANAMHLAGRVGQLAGNRARVANQSGAGGLVVGRTALTAAALGVTA